MVNSEGKGPTDVEDALRDLNDLKGQTQNPCTGTRIDDLLCLDTPATITAGTEPFGFGPNKKMYINHYEVIITAGMAAKGEGLLYLPLVKARIPVEWSGLQVNRSQTGDYGCVLAPGQIQMQGSQSGVISGDLFRQVMALLTQGPGSFSGKFGEALEAAKKLADELLAKIAAGTPLTPDEITKYKGVCKAVKEGINAYKVEIEVQIPAPRGAEVDQILADLQTAKIQFQELVDCNSLGYNNRFDTEKTERFEYQKGPFANFTSLACNLSQGKTEAVKVIESVEKLTLMLKPSPNETYSQRNYSCLNGTKAILTFNPGITNSVTEGIDPPVWTLNNSQYYLYWKADASGIVGFYAKNEVDLLKSSGVTISSVILEKVPKFTSYIVSSIEPNSSDCKKKSSDFDPNSMGDYFTDAGLNRLKDKLAQQGASNTEITVKDCTDPTKVPKTVTSSSISASKGQNSIQIEMCWNGTKWVSTILKYEPATSYAQARGMTKISEAAQAAKDAAKNALDNNQGIDAFSKQSTSADGFTHEFKVGSADALESAVYFLETGKYLIENLQVPPESWQGGGPSKKVLSIPPVLGGGTDQGLAEVKDLKQMVDLGVAFVKEPASTLGGIWDGVTGMSLEDAKNTLLGDWVERKANYEKGSPYDWYQGGKDGVSSVKYVMAGGFTAIRTGLEGATDNLIPAFQKRLKEIDDYISGGEYLKKVNDDWDLFKNRKGWPDTKEITDSYKARHETITRNRKKGKIGEEVFQDLEGGEKLPTAVDVGGKRRFIDNVKGDVAREVKSGRVTNANKAQLDVDIDLMADPDIRLAAGGINKVEWHCFDGADESFKTYLANKLAEKGLPSNAVQIIEYTIK